MALDVACYLLDNWEPSLEKRAKIEDEHTVELQGLSLTGKSIDPKQVSPGPPDVAPEVGINREANESTITATKPD